MTGDEPSTGGVHLLPGPRLPGLAGQPVGEQLLVEGAGALNGLLHVLAHDGAAGGLAGDFRVLDRGGEVVRTGASA